MEQLLALAVITFILLASCMLVALAFKILWRIFDVLWSLI